MLGKLQFISMLLYLYMRLWILYKKYNYRISREKDNNESVHVYVNWNQAHIP